MSLKKLLNALIISIISLSVTSGIALGLDDGFGEARVIESKYFVIYYSPQLDANNLTENIKINSIDKIIAGKSRNKEYSMDAGLGSMLDALFIQVSDVLDMHIYSLQINIKICKDYEQLGDIYRNIFDKELTNRSSFYINDMNTIYISVNSFGRGILAHEIAHAIISHYFVVQPPVRVAEILAGYAEYELRKGTQR